MLNLQLKRFEYDFQRDTMVKVGGLGTAGGWWLDHPPRLLAVLPARQHMPCSATQQDAGTGHLLSLQMLHCPCNLPPHRGHHQLLPTACPSLPILTLSIPVLPPPLQINDRYEFSEDLDLDVGDGKYLAPTADRSVRNLYKLHSVLVHSGGVHGGHYYAFIRPDCKTWLKFDDERVSKEDRSKALDEQYGGGGGRG